MNNDTHYKHKAFISFASRDLELACKLNDALDKQDIYGYIFLLDQQYDSTLHEKITKAISNSQTLIAIITNGPNSPSVHEEIGYAFAKGKPVIVMAERNAEDGVLSREREHEEFTRGSFDNSCSKVVAFIHSRVSNMGTTVDSAEFLKERGLLDSNARNFCMTANSTNIINMMMEREPTAHPVVLFSACPVKLLDEIPINSPEYAKWSNRFSRVPVSETQIDFLQGNQKFEFGKTTYYYDHEKHFSMYLEIHSNGFIEQGHSKSLIDTHNFESIGKKSMLHSCWTAGTFWAFLVFCREHYKKHVYSDEIDIFLSIRDARALRLAGFTTGYLMPEPLGWSARLPTTNLPNIQINKRIMSNEMSERQIEKMTREFSDKIANAYGLQSALCYDQEGQLDTRALSKFQLR